MPTRSDTGLRLRYIGSFFWAYRGLRRGADRSLQMLKVCGETVGQQRGSGI